MQDDCWEPGASTSDGDGDSDVDKFAGSMDSARLREHRAFWCIQHDNWLRSACTELMLHPWFDRCILAVIVVNAGFIAADDPLETGPPTRFDHVRELSDDIFLGVFVLEMLIKLTAMGGLLHPGAYLRDYWNVLDCVIVGAGVLGMAIQSGTGAFSTLRMIRIFRPLRTISRVSGMRNLVNTIIHSLPFLGNVALLCLLLFMVFGLIGVITWSTTLHQRCYGPNPVTGEPMWTTVCDNTSVKMSYFAVGCAEGFLCREGAPNANAWANWDHIGNAFLLVWQCMSLDDWVTHMYDVQDGWNPFGAIYFIMLTLIGAFFVLNLVLAVVTDSFYKFEDQEDEVRAARAKDIYYKQKAELDLQAQCVYHESGGAEPAPSPLALPPSTDMPLSLSVHPLLTTTNPTPPRTPQPTDRPPPPAGPQRSLLGSQNSSDPPRAPAAQQLLGAVDVVTSGDETTTSRRQPSQRQLLGAPPNPLQGDGNSPDNTTGQRRRTRASSLFERNKQLPPAVPPAQPAAETRSARSMSRHGERAWSSMLTSINQQVDRLRSVQEWIEDLHSAHPGGVRERAETALAPPIQKIDHAAAGPRRRSDGNVLVDSSGTVQTRRMVELIAIAGSKSLRRLDAESRRKLLQFTSSACPDDPNGSPQACPNGGGGRPPEGVAALTPPPDSPRLLTGGQISPRDRKRTMISDQPVIIDDPTSPNSPRDNRSPLGDDGVLTSIRWLARDMVEHRVFNNAMSTLIVLNALLMSIEHYHMPVWLVDILEVANVVFVGVFTFETVVKLFALGPTEWVRDRFNVFDFIIVLVSIFEITFLTSSTATVFRGMRLVRVVRVVKLARRWRILNHIISTVGECLGYMGYLLLLLMLFVFVFAILGRQLFSGRVPRCCTEAERATGRYDCKDGALDQYIWDSCWRSPIDRAHFDNLYWSSILVFQLVTEDYWSGVMYKTMTSCGALSAAYFFAVIFLGRYLLLNLFVAILLVGLEREHKTKDDKSSQGGETVAELLKDIDLDEDADSEEAEFSAYIPARKAEERKQRDEERKRRERAERRIRELAGEEEERAQSLQLAASPGASPVKEDFQFGSPSTIASPSMPRQTSGLQGSEQPPPSPLAEHRSGTVSVFGATLLGAGPAAHSSTMLLGASTLGASAVAQPGSPPGGGRAKRGRRMRSQSLFQQLEHAPRPDEALDLDDLSPEEGPPDDKAVQAEAEAASARRRRRGSTVQVSSGSAAPPARTGSMVSLKRGSGDTAPPQPLSTGLLAGLRGPKLGGSRVARARRNSVHRLKTQAGCGVQDVFFTREHRGLVLCWGSQQQLLREWRAVVAVGNDEFAEVLVGQSWGCVSPDNRVRQFLWHVINGRYFPFEKVISYVIFASCIALTVNGDLIGQNQTVIDIMEILDMLFTIIFFAEVWMRITVYTFNGRTPLESQTVIEGEEEAKPIKRLPSAYIQRARWNWLDCAIVAVSVLALPFRILAAGETGTEVARQVYNVARALRAWRPLRILVRSKNMKIVISAILGTIPAVFNVMAVATFAYFMFGVASVQLFKGAFMGCNDGSNKTHAQCDPESYFTRPPGPPFDTWYSDKDLKLPNGTVIAHIRRRWINQYDFSFNHVATSLLTLLQCAILNGWTDVMYAVVDSTSEEDGPTVRNNQEGMALLIVLWIFVGGLGIMNIFIGCVVDYFNSIKTRLDRSALLTRGQMQTLRIKKILRHQKAKQRLVPQLTEDGNLPGPCHSMAGFCFWVVDSPLFSPFIVSCIVLNIVVMASTHYRQVPEWSYFQRVSNLTFTCIFTAEMLLKIGVVKYRAYVATMWNRLDGAIVIASWFEVFITELVTQGNAGSVAQLLRIGRMMRLVRHLKGLKKLLLTLYYSVPALLNIGSLLALVFFIFGVMGTVFFEKIRKVKHTGTYSEYYNEHLNFDNFLRASLSLYRVACFDNWRRVVAASLMDEPYCKHHLPEGGSNCGATHPVLQTLTSAYYASFVLIVGFVMMNLFIAVVLENFRDNVLLPPELLSKMELIKLFREKWSYYDPRAVQVIKARDFVPLMRLLPSPMGFADCDVTTDVLPSLLHLDFPVTRDNNVLFIDAIDAIGETVFRIRLVDRKVTEQHLLQSGEHTHVVKGKKGAKRDKEVYFTDKYSGRRGECHEGAVFDTQYTIADWYAASIIQAAWMRWANCPGQPRPRGSAAWVHRQRLYPVYVQGRRDLRDCPHYPAKAEMRRGERVETLPCGCRRPQPGKLHINRRLHQLTIGGRWVPVPTKERFPFQAQSLSEDIFEESYREFPKGRPATSFRQQRRPGGSIRRRASVAASRLLADSFLNRSGVSRKDAAVTAAPQTPLKARAGSPMGRGEQVFRDTVNEAMMRVRGQPTPPATPGRSAQSPKLGPDSPVMHWQPLSFSRSADGTRDGSRAASSARSRRSSNRSRSRSKSRSHSSGSEGERQSPARGCTIDNLLEELGKNIIRGANGMETTDDDGGSPCSSDRDMARSTLKLGHPDALREAAAAAAAAPAGAQITETWPRRRRSTRRMQAGRSDRAKTGLPRPNRAEEPVAPPQTRRRRDTPRPAQPQAAPPQNVAQLLGGIGTELQSESGSSATPTGEDTTKRPPLAPAPPAASAASGSAASGGSGWAAAAAPPPPPPAGPPPLAPVVAAAPPQPASLPPPAGSPPGAPAGHPPALLSAGQASSAKHQDLLAPAVSRAPAGPPSGLRPLLPPLQTPQLGPAAKGSPPLHGPGALPHPRPSTRGSPLSSGVSSPRLETARKVQPLLQNRLAPNGSRSGLRGPASPSSPGPPPCPSQLPAPHRPTSQWRQAHSTGTASPLSPPTQRR